MREENYQISQGEEISLSLSHQIFDYFALSHKILSFALLEVSILSSFVSQSQNLRATHYLHLTV